MKFMDKIGLHIVTFSESRKKKLNNYTIKIWKTQRPTQLAENKYEFYTCSHHASLQKELQCC